VLDAAALAAVDADGDVLVPPWAPPELLLPHAASRLATPSPPEA
jgi:hypothetical protein